MERPDLDILGRTELFRGATIEALADIHAGSYIARFAAGERVLAQGEDAANVYVVVVGRLRASQTTADGRQVILRYLGPGDIVGYTALTSGDHHPGDVVAVTDSRLIGWRRPAMREIMTRHPAIAINAIAVLGARYHDMQVRLRELSTEKVEQRIAHAILRLARAAGRRPPGRIEIAFPLSRQDLAEITGTTLHTVSRTLSGWEDQGFVDSGRRRVIVRDVAALTSIAEATGRDSA